MLLKNFDKNQYVYILFLLIIYTFTALNNVGFYNDDEHFQILEPVAYLLGINNILLNDPQNINWEWEVDHRIRPWFQSYLYYHVILFLKFFNLNNPFIWAFSIKFLNGLLGIISIIYLFNTLKKYFLKSDNLENYIIFFTFWFFPFIHLRTSSESLGIILFCIALPP